MVRTTRPWRGWRAEVLDDLQRLGRVEAPDIAAQIRIWQLLARSALAGSGTNRERAAAAQELRETFEKLNYVVVPAGPGKSRQEYAEGWTAILPDASLDCPQALDLGRGRDCGFAFALKIPSGHTILPTAWVRVPPSWLKPDSDPLLRVLADEEPTLLRLWQRHLRSQDSLLAQWVHDLVQSQGAKSVDLTPIEVFEGLVREVQALEATSDRALKALAPDALRIAQAVREALRDQADAAVLGVPLTRDLRIDFEVLALPSGCRVEIDWEEAPGSAASPEVLDFKFARDFAPGWLRLRPGRDVPRATLAWARLPEPVAAAEPMTAALLGDLPAAYRRAPLSPPSGIDSLHKRLVSQLSDSARLTGWIAEARRGPAGAACSWLAAYLRLPRPPAVPLYPDLDPETLEPRWPETLDVDARLARPNAGLHWVARDDLEAGRVVPAAPLCFATDIAHVRCTFSRGPRDRYSAMDAAAALAEEVAAAPDPLRLALNLASRRRFYLCEDALRRGVDPTPTAMEAATWLDDALERLLAEAGVASGLGTAADAILAQLRAWGEAVGLVVLPRIWSFADPPRAVDVPADEVLPIGMPTRFDTGQGVAGCLVLTAFGLTGGPGGDRPARGVVSAGPPPQGFEAFRAELDETRSGPPTPTPESAAALESLAAGLAAWPTAAARGYLEADALDTFLKFYATLGVGYRAEAPAQYQKLAAALVTLMNEGFGQVTFEPRTHREFAEGWIEPRNPPPYQTGRVRRVLRPGLRSRTGELTSPAQVKVE